MEGNEKSMLKRERETEDEGGNEAKKARTSPKLQYANPMQPSPVTHDDSMRSKRSGTATPPEGRPSQIKPHPPSTQLDSPPRETQPLTQTPRAEPTLSTDVIDEEKEGVWGYLIPLDNKFGEPLVLRRRAACPVPHPNKDETGKDGKKNGKEATKKRDQFKIEEKQYEEKKAKEGVPSGGYLIGRHRECDRVLDLPTISNRHCLIFNETKESDAVAVLQDLSSNGTFVNEAIVGRNKHRELHDYDEIAILDQTRFIFRYPKNRQANGFERQYRILDQLGRGHFATVFLCVERTTGDRFAVKRFEKRPGEAPKLDGLQQEIGVLMSVSHANVMCLKDSFDDPDGVYLVLELAPEGELFNWIVANKKLSESDCRKVFIQLFQGIKYLHDRGIVHRDIKPENILLVDKNLRVKLADFGLAKIIGETSFTTTLCGTPSYVAPEILENKKHRRYTRAVDIWSLGVVLYICLCGFPPFSDELKTPSNPYTLLEQIKLGRFDFPSPYWDSIGDPALDLIDKMLNVDMEKRATIEECLEHPWLTQKPLDLTSSMDSTDGLSGAMRKLDFSKRKPARERTLLSSLNSVKVSKITPDGEKIWERQPRQERTLNIEAKGPQHMEKEDAPDANRNPAEFVEMGGVGDQQLFGDDEDTRYTVNEISAGSQA